MLILPIVFLQRAFPDDLRASLLRCLHRAGMDRLPELMRRSLGNDSDRVFLVLPQCRQNGGGNQSGAHELDPTGSHRRFLSYVAKWSRHARRGDDFSGRGLHRQWEDTFAALTSAGVLLVTGCLYDKQHANDQLYLGQLRRAGTELQGRRYFRLGYFRPRAPRRTGSRVTTSKVPACD